ncbi:MAG: YARHG domain-containing protein [Bacteroidales bacterium]
MKRILILFLMLFGFGGVMAQNNPVIDDYEYSKYRFIGFKGKTPVYQCIYRYDEPIKNAINFALYYSEMQKNGYVKFSFIRKFKKEHSIYYFNNDCLIYRKSKGKDIYIGKIKSKMEYQINTIGDLDIYRKTHRLTQGKYFYFSTLLNKTRYLARIDITEEQPEMEVLPIKGSEPILLDNWLYYKIAYETSKHAIGSVSSVYRVKVGNWRYPELLINNVEFRGAVIDTNLLSFTVYDKNEWREVTYNISDSTYIEQQISSLIKYNGKKYQKTLCENPETGKMQYCYEDIPELPEEFPHKLERDIEPNHNYFHLPHTKKPFTDTFITDSLLFFAGKEDLQKLSKSQLRKLRNAFYAREGYDFKSADLQEFFGQFDWYEQTLKKRKAHDLTNDDIYIPPADKERIKLIQEIENNK